MVDLSPSLAAYGAAFMATLLAASAIHKLTDWRRLARSAAVLANLGDAWGVPVLACAAVAEFIAAIALVSPATRVIGAVGAAGLWSVYLAGIMRALRTGRSDIDCGCAFGRGRAPLGRFEVGRNLALVGLAVLVALGAHTASDAVIGLSEMLAGVALFSLYVAVDQLALLAPGWR